MVASIGRLFPLVQEDRLLSVLPIHHSFEFACGLLLPLSMGARIYLDEINGDRLSFGLKEGRVTCMVGVPALGSCSSDASGVRSRSGARWSSSASTR